MGNSEYEDLSVFNALKQIDSKKIEKFLKHINEKYQFGFNKDFLLRTCLVLVNDGKSGISMQELAKTKTIENIRANWDAIKKTIEKCSAIMKNIDLDDEKILSYNAIIPIMFYLYKGGKIHDYLEREELRKYFAISFAKGLFGGSSNTAITNTCSSIKDNFNNKFSIEYFAKTEFSGGRNFHVDIQLINKWIETYNKGAKTYFILMLLSPNLNLLEDKFDQDHSHAYTLFNDSTLKENNVPETRIGLWKEKRNHLPNLSFMQESRNRSKNKTDLTTWIKDNPDKVSSLILLPADTSYDLANFEHFYMLRRSMMKYVLTSLFGVGKEKINIGDEVTINTSIQKGEFGNTQNMTSGMHGHVTKLQGSSSVNGKEMIPTAFVEFENDNGTLFSDYVPIQFLYLVEPFDKELEIS